MNKINTIILSACAATVFMPLASMAAGTGTNNDGYLVSAPGASNVVSGDGLCWRSGSWNPSLYADSCGGAPQPVAQAPEVIVVPAPQRVAEAPKVVVVAALPVVAKPLPQKISFSGDALFAFDQSSLKPEGKRMLDGLVRQLEGATYDNIVATGHTDRLGSNNYNQRLSERRAIAVKDYLVSQNIQANRVDARGSGETQPITKTGECTGAERIQVVTCLQPDRRVDVELIGAQTIVRSL